MAEEWERIFWRRAFIGLLVRMTFFWLIAGAVMALLFLLFRWPWWLGWPVMLVPIAVLVLRAIPWYQRKMRGEEWRRWQAQ